MASISAPAQHMLTKLEVEDGVCFLTLDHPQKRNALSRAMLMEMHSSLAQIADDKEVRVVVLRASGPVFSSGHDLRELDSTTSENCADLFALCTQVMEAVRCLPQPVIAQVQGLATAAGCQLVASCDLVVAAEEASFATPGVKIGLFCTTPGVALSRVVSPRHALEMLLTGRAIPAREAERLGLVNRVVSAERLSSETLALAREIQAASSYTVALGKRAFYTQLGLDRAAAYRFAEQIMVENVMAPDALEGIRAFLEKRKPQWPADRSIN